jgi:L-rhamnose mutarotase
MDHTLGTSPDHPVVKGWWAHMAHTMGSEPDNQPVVAPLETIIHIK